MKGGTLEEYSAIWKEKVTPEMFDVVYYYYNNIDFKFLVEKMIRELNGGNAGGPQVRSRFSNTISVDELAQSAINGLRVLLTIKTFENAFPFKEKTRITDDSMLTDLAWHSLMLKPHKYYLITHTILKFISANKTNSNTKEMRKIIDKKLKQINKDVVVRNLLDAEPESDIALRSSGSTRRGSTRRSAKNALVRHGTDVEVKLEIDIRDFIIKLIKDNEYKLNMNVIIKGNELKGHEWNMPLPLFP